MSELTGISLVAKIEEQSTLAIVEALRGALQDIFEAKIDNETAREAIGLLKGVIPKIEQVNIENCQIDQSRQGSIEDFEEPAPGDGDL